MINKTKRALIVAAMNTQMNKTDARKRMLYRVILPRGTGNEKGSPLF